MEANPTENTVPPADVEMGTVSLSVPKNSQGNLSRRDVLTADLEFLENKALEFVQKVHQLKARDLSQVEEGGFGLACKLLGQAFRALDLAAGMGKRTLPRLVAGNTKNTETQRESKRREDKARRKKERKERRWRRSLTKRSL